MTCSSVAAFRPGRQFQERLAPATAGGATHGLNLETFQNGRQQPAILARADHRGHAGSLIALFDVAEVGGHAKRQPIVPDTIDGLAGRLGAVEITGAVAPLVTQG